MAILSAAVSAITPLEGRDGFEVARDFTSLDVSTFSDGRAKLTVVGGWTAMGVASLAWAVLFGQLRAVLGNVKADKPFAAANARYMALAGVFRHGSYLQQEHDDTV